MNPAGRRQTSATQPRAAASEAMNKQRRNGLDTDSEAARSRYLGTGPRYHWEADVGAIRVFFGEGRLGELGTIVEDLAAKRVLVVSDQGVHQAGHVQRALETLSTGSIEVRLYDGATENPTTDLVEAAARQVADFEPDCIVGLGGGSSMDCAKAINFLLTNGGSITDYWGYGQTHASMLPSIGIPTTAGTGSEAQSFALISDSESGRKMACGDPQALFRTVVLDPGLIASAPTRVAAAAGIDALSHAIESHVSTRRNPISRVWSMRAWELLHSSLQSPLSKEADLADVGEMLLGAHLAGAAIEQSMLGAAHACANPLTATYGISHGQAIGVLLPHVVRFNSSVVADDYSTLNDLAGLNRKDEPGDTLATYIEQLRQTLELPDSLHDLGVSRGDLEALAEAAVLEWTARFNPRPVSQAELFEIYESAY